MPGPHPVHFRAGLIHLRGIGVAACYIHSHAGILHAHDYDNAVKLIVEAVKRLDAKTVAGLCP